MIEVSVLQAYLDPVQIYAALMFIPLVCWYFAHGLSLLGRWCALCSGYSVQIGFFLLLDDVGLQTNLLILLASVAAYFWIATTLVLLPGMARKNPHPAKAVEAADPLPAPSQEA
jgi:hypothetical protein